MKISLSTGHIFNSPQMKSMQVNQPSVSFRARAQRDTFVSNTHELTRGEKYIENIINSAREGEAPLRLNKRTLARLNMYTQFDSKIPIKYLSLTGHNAYRLAVRRYMLENISIGGKRKRYKFAVYETLLNDMCKDKVIDSTGFAKINRKKNDCRIESKFKEFLAVLYASTSASAVYEFLRPHIEKELFNLDNDKMLFIIQAYYKYAPSVNERGNNFNYVCSENSDSRGKYKASGYKNEHEIMTSYGDTTKEAVSKMLSLVMEDLELKPSKLKNHKATENYSEPTAKSIKQTEKLLEDIGFFENRISLYKKADAQKINYFKHLLSAENYYFSFDFRELAFYGDSVLNLFVSRFLAEKNIAKESRLSCYKILSSKKSHTETSKELNLRKYITEPKYYAGEAEAEFDADAIKALAGALALSYNEERVYEYFKPIFEKRFQNILDES